MKETLIRLLSSSLKAASLSVVFTGVAYFTYIPLLPVFVVTFVGQFILSYLYNSYLELQAAKIIKEQRLKELDILARVTFNIPCAACKVVNEVIVNPQVDNQFTCPHCDAKNAVYLSAEAALITEPIRVDNI